MRLCCLVLALCSLSAPAVMGQGAQPRARVEVEGGPGYSVGGGSEGHAPSLPTWTAGATIWLSKDVGLFGSRVVGVGDDPIRQAQGSDRDYLAQTGLRFWRWSVRYRRGDGTWRIVAGLGFVHGRYGERFRLRRDGRVLEASQQWGGPLLEVHGERSLAKRLAVRAGLTYNGYTDPFVFHPQVTMVLRF